MTAAMRRVCVESPLRGSSLPRNVMYADACQLDCLLRRNEAPFLGHLMYPRVLNDSIDLHRTLGIAAHCSWLGRADAVAVYTDLGISGGMGKAIELAELLGIPIEYRTLGADWMQWFLAEAHATDGFFD